MLKGPGAVARVSLQCCYSFYKAASLQGNTTVLTLSVQAM